MTLVALRLLLSLSAVRTVVRRSSSVIKIRIASRTAWLGECFFNILACGKEWRQLLCCEVWMDLETYQNRIFQIMWHIRSESFKSLHLQDYSKKFEKSMRKYI